MITITIPEWLVWLAVGATLVQLVLNIVMARLQRQNQDSTNRLIDKMFELLGLK